MDFPHSQTNFCLSALQQTQDDKQSSKQFVIITQQTIEQFPKDNDLFRIIIRLNSETNEKVIISQNRPQSAKPGYRAPANQNSADDINDHDFIHKNVIRKQVKLLKPDLTTNDFSRVMPKKIYQDKERLYSEGLQLKQKLNEMQEENIRLKTRISILEKEKDKLTKAIDSVADSSNKSQSRLKVFAGPSKSSDKQNAMVRNLKKIIRQSKQQNQYLRQENAKIKKAVKFAKINELEIECKILRQEYHKLEQILVDMNQKLTDQQDYERENNQLKNYLEEEVQANKQLSQSNQGYVEYIEQLEEKLKKQTEKGTQKQKKLQRDLALNKRKLTQSLKASEDLRKQLRSLKQNVQNDKKKPIPARNITRPMTSNPYSRPASKQENASTVNVNVEAQKKLDELKNKNQKLEQELKEIRLKLQKSQKEKQQSPKKKQQQESQLAKDLRLDSQLKQNYDDEKFQQEFVLSPQKKKENGRPASSKNQANFILKQDKKAEEDLYEDEFEEEAKQEMPTKLASNKKIDNNVQKYNHDQEEQEEEEQLYKKQDTKKDKSKEKTRKKKNSDRENKGYQPNKQILSEIKQLLTYRMKAQRYPPEELEKDIILSKQSKFSYEDLQSMLKTEPFYLKPEYTSAFLEYIFQKKKVASKESVTAETFLKKIKKVIKSFTLTDEKEQEQRLMSIAEMTTQYPDELENAFEKIKNGPDTVAKKDLVEMFKKLELADHFIEIIICELSLCSDDLEHLSIRGYFQRFYVQDMQNSDDNNAIDQEQIQSSGELPSGKKQNKIGKIDQEDEYEDDKVNFILEDEGELSMGVKAGQQQEYNDDIVSDDGHI